MKGQARLLSGIAALSLAVIVTAIACIYARHESRKQFTELQALTEERDRLEVEWGRLQIEQSAWSTHARVEQLARKKMKMRNPVAMEVTTVVQQ